MANFWMNFAIEIAVLSFLGVLYYFYQKRKILNYEENKVPLVMNFILESCLSHKTEEAQPMLDTLIEQLDDYLKEKIMTPPLALLRAYADSTDCAPELKSIIDEGLKEISE
jgi:hypothetical protein